MSDAENKKPYLSEKDPIYELRHRSVHCTPFWAEGLPYWLLAETCLALADKVDALQEKLNQIPSKNWPIGLHD